MPNAPQLSFTWTLTEDNTEGSVIVTILELTHPPASVTVTIWTPAHKPVAVESV